MHICRSIYIHICTYTYVYIWNTELHEWGKRGIEILSPSADSLLTCPQQLVQVGPRAGASSRSLMWVQGPRTWAIFFCFPVLLLGSWIEKWSNQDLKHMGSWRCKQQLNPLSQNVGLAGQRPSLPHRTTNTTRGLNVSGTGFELR